MRFLFTFSFFLLASTAIGQRITLYKNDSLMRNEILNYIPIGSDLSVAKRIMESNKFNPYEHFDSPVWKNNREIYSHVNYIDYNRTKKPLVGFVSTTWEIFILFKDGKVTEVVCVISYTGP